MEWDAWFLGSFWVTVDSCYVQLFDLRLHTAKPTVEGEETAEIKMSKFKKKTNFSRNTIFAFRGIDFCFTFSVK